MNRLSVIIPSRNCANYLQCCAAVKLHEPTARVALVDDGIEPEGTFSSADLDIKGEKPFSFPRNVNLGLRATGTDDVLVLNDDALLETPGGFSLLQQAAEEHPEFGIISASTNISGNPNQRKWVESHPAFGLRTESRVVAFIAVLIPRRTIDRVGFLDERFGGLTAEGTRIYGFDDNDYCRRIRKAGLKIGIHDSCFVDHSRLQSTFRKDARASGDVRAAARLYLAKWGDEIVGEEREIVRRMAA